MEIEAKSCFSYIFKQRGTENDNSVVGERPTRRMVTLNTDLSLLELLVPDALKIFRQRYLILEQISLHAPIGRRTVARQLGLSERNIRTETDYLRDQGLIEIKNFGMFLTEKGESVVKDAAPIVDRLFNASQAEVWLAQALGIDRTIIVAGDADLQSRVYDLAGEELNSALNLLLPLADCIVTVMGGKTIAKVAKKLNRSLSENRSLIFVPGRGALGGRVNTESNAVVQEMARATGGSYESLFLPEHVSKDAYRSLVRDPEISRVLQDISQSDVVIHGIGLASEMARRRGYDSVALARLRENKAVTECFGCFFDEEGHVVERIRQVGLQFENLTNVPHILAIALGTRKAKAIKAYMRNAPHQTWLITDEAAANQILNGSSRLK